MTANVFEESTLTLSANIARGKGDRATAKFVFEQEGGAETVEASELELGGKEGGTKKVSTTVTLPKCKDDEDFYTLSYKVECNGAEYPGGDFKIWLKTAKFKAVDADGAALKGVPINFNQTGEKVYVTDSKGEVPLPINATAPATVVVRSPCSIDSWKTEVGRLREATVTKMEYKAVIVDPSLEGNSEGDPRKQYVNLPVDAKAPTQGSKMKITVGGATDTECIPGVPEDPVYVKLEFDTTDLSKRNDPKRALIIGGTPIEPNDKGIAEGETKFDEKGEAVFEVELGQAGGDKVKIHTGITKACEDSTLHVANWRKLWYQLTLPAGADAPDLTRMKDALKEVFVEYIQEGEPTEVPEDDGPAGSWFDGAWIGENGKMLNVGDHNKNHFHGKFNDTKSPHMVHIMCCHAQYDTGWGNTQVDYTGISVGKDDKVKWSDGSDVLGFEQTPGLGFFPKSMKDGGSSLISGSWESDDGSKKGNITDADLHIVKSTFTLKLPDDAVDYINEDADNNTISVDVSVFKAQGPFLGEADNPNGWLQLIVIRLAEKVSNDVMAHELGHTMGQVPQSAADKPPGLSAVAHGREYTANGHQGGHCADGMSDDNYGGGTGKAGSAYENDFTGAPECTCIMYGENGEGSKCTGKFCARCQPFIKGQALTTLH